MVWSQIVVVPLHPPRVRAREPQVRQAAIVTTCSISWSPIKNMTKSARINQPFYKSELMPRSKREDVSIVMPVYNHAGTLVTAIESVMMQEMAYSSILYCLDDASTDNSAAILERFKTKISG